MQSVLCFKSGTVSLDSVSWGSNEAVWSGFYWTLQLKVKGFGEENKMTKIRSFTEFAGFFSRKNNKPLCSGKYPFVMSQSALIPPKLRGEHSSAHRENLKLALFLFCFCLFVFFLLIKASFLTGTKTDYFCFVFWIVGYLFFFIFLTDEQRAKCYFPEINGLRNY